MLTQIWALEKKEPLFYYSFIYSANLKYISLWLTYMISLSQQGVAEFLTRRRELYFAGKLGLPT